jgi:hypothetical protein
MRYVPLITGEWESTKTYEPLTVVLYKGSSYTSKNYVPAGIYPVEGTTSQYWALTGNYNAQVEQYRQETQEFFTTSSEHLEIVDTTLMVHGSHISTSQLNMMKPPAPLVGLKGDGTEEGELIQSLIHFAEDNNYNVVYFPKPPVSYKCSANIDVLMNKLSVKGENSLFDFTNATEYGFRLLNNETNEHGWTKKYKLLHTFEGIIFNTYTGTKSPISNIVLEGQTIGETYSELAHIVIKQCMFANADYGIEIRDHVWRIHFENCVTMNNTHVFKMASNVFDTGENINFYNCGFFDGSDITLYKNIDFSNCSFDNVSIYLYNDCFTFSQCHFERPNVLFNQTTPYIALMDNNARAILNECKILPLMNNIKWNVSPFQCVDGNVYRGFIFNNCDGGIINRNQLNTASFISEGKFPCIFGGKGRYQIHSLLTPGDNNVAIGLSDNINCVSNGNAEDATTIPFTIITSEGSLVEITTTDHFTGSKCFHFHSEPSGKISTEISVPVEAGKMIIVVYMYKVDTHLHPNGSGYGYTFSCNIRYNAPRQNSYNPFATANDVLTWQLSNAVLSDIVPKGATTAKIDFNIDNHLNALSTVDAFFDEVSVYVI